ncbi:unnamed protein product [Cylindrotheca closterium]|uniref:AAA+ ATPase domain-containing protein n=1 Tax=Cylindrotheca closterium TaxID=2856 RepID=A0AAD2FHK1_9STRA|nr:unnamed protein product [Cylindrotheca closterium]
MATFKFPHIFLTGHPSVGKTTIIKGVQSSIQQKCNGTDGNVTISGFYTEECRNKSGNRIGFDIVYWPTPATRTQKQPSEPQRVALSRMVDRIQKGKPFVGKYLVDIDNVAKYAVGSISAVETVTTSKNQRSPSLVILDEIGKMEMLCPQFIPAVNKLLDDSSNPTTRRVVFGTLPTPRYGRVIPDVESVRARDNVLVLHVTKDNRDELQKLLSEILSKVLLFDISNDDSSGLIKALEPYRYIRPIGASSLSGDKKKEGTNVHKKNQKADKRGTNLSTGESTATSVKPSGPLLSPSIPPKVLIVGETASPLPSNPEYAYCERSMWIVLSKMFDLPTYKPILDPSSASETAMASYKVVKNLALAKGICIWDVLANVHQKSKGRKKQKPVDTPNDIQGLLKKYPSIEMIGFIGQKAHAKYKSLLHDDPAHDDGRDVQLVTLPSSSPSNTRLSVVQKVDAWKSAFEKEMA